MNETTNESTGQPGDVGALLADVRQALDIAANYPGLGPAVGALHALTAAVAALAARVA